MAVRTTTRASSASCTVAMAWPGQLQDHPGRAVRRCAGVPGGLAQGYGCCVSARSQRLTMHLFDFQPGVGTCSTFLLSRLPVASPLITHYTVSLSGSAQQQLIALDGAPHRGVARCSPPTQSP